MVVSSLLSLDELISRPDPLPPGEANGGVAGKMNSGSTTSPDLEIVHGEPLTDRKSTFQAHVASVKSVAEVCINTLAVWWSHTTSAWLHSVTSNIL